MKYLFGYGETSKQKNIYVGLSENVSEMGYFRVRRQVRITNWDIPLWLSLWLRNQRYEGIYQSRRCLVLPLFLEAEKGG